MKSVAATQKQANCKSVGLYRAYINIAERFESASVLVCWLFRVDSSKREVNFVQSNCQ